MRCPAAQSGYKAATLPRTRCVAATLPGHGEDARRSIMLTLLNRDATRRRSQIARTGTRTSATRATSRCRAWPPPNLIAPTELHEETTSRGPATKYRIARPRSRQSTRRHRRRQKEPVGKWLKFWQGVLHVDASKMDLGIGLRNALGVALPLAIGIAIKMPLGGLAVASGALNVSYSDGHDPYRQRAKRMLATSALCAIAVMAGGLAGHYSVLPFCCRPSGRLGGICDRAGSDGRKPGRDQRCRADYFRGAGFDAGTRAASRRARFRRRRAANAAFDFVLAGACIRPRTPRALQSLSDARQSRRRPAQLMRCSPPGIEASTAAQEAFAGRASDHTAIGERFRSLAQSGGTHAPAPFYAGPPAAPHAPRKIRIRARRNGRAFSRIDFSRD